MEMGLDEMGWHPAYKPASLHGRRGVVVCLTRARRISAKWDYIRWSCVTIGQLCGCMQVASFPVLHVGHHSYRRLHAVQVARYIHTASDDGCGRGLGTRLGAAWSDVQLARDVPQTYAAVSFSTPVCRKTSRFARYELVLSSSKWIAGCIVRSGFVFMALIINGQMMPVQITITRISHFQLQCINTR